MTKAATERVAFRYVEETEWGTTPAENMKGLLVTSEDTSPDYETEESESIRGDRQIPHIVRVGKEGSGGMNFELRYSVLDDFLRAALGASSWDADTPEAGTDRIENGSDLVSFTLEKEFQDVGHFWAFPGMVLGDLSLDFSPRSRVTGSATFMGQGGSPADATAGSGTEAADENPMMVSSAGLTINIDGEPINIVTEFSLNLENNLRAQNALGSVDPIGVGLGLFRPSGSLTAYFEDRSLIDHIHEDTEFSMDLAVTDADGNELKLIWPAVKFTNLSGLENTGRSEDVLPQLDWTAKMHDTDEIMMAIERTPAA